jgi:hypothetical protein
MNNYPANQQPISPQRVDPDQINLLEYMYALVHRKWWIIGATVLGLILGYSVASIKGPRYVADAVIAPRENDSQKMPNLSALGAFGGLVAGQLGLGANPGLDKIDIVINTKDFNASFIDQNNLLPQLYKYKWPKIYLKMWDPAKHDWKPEFQKPKRLDMGAFLKGAFVKNVINKNNTMTISISSKDSTFSMMVLNKYLDFLNNYIKTTIQNDANENVEYLNKQLETVADPLLREKFHGLIANEVEKAMLVSKEAFKIVDPVYQSKTFKEKKLYPVVFGFGLFFLTCLIIIFVYAFSAADKTEEDKKLIDKIKKEILSLPGK